MPARIIRRPALLAEIEDRIRHNPIVALLGPRQSGKTTVARWISSRHRARFFDLEDPADRRALEQPMAALSPLEGVVVIDEAQSRPELFPVLRVLADRQTLPARFVLTGSASPELIRGASESLAGRIAFVKLAGFDLDEVGPKSWRKLWTRGGFPRSYLSLSDAESLRWRQGFVETFLERDLRQHGVQAPSAMLRRFWYMVAHYHGQIWNGSEIGRSLGEAHTTVRRHLDILTGALVVRQLQPWFVNIGKRLVKSPKIYVRDSGLLHVLLGISDSRDLERHPKLGASWEGFVVEEILRVTGDREAWFWATRGLSELDLLVRWQGRMVGFEVKYADAPGMTKSMHSAMHDLDLERLFVVYPGSRAYTLADGVEAIPLASLRKRLMDMVK